MNDNQHSRSPDDCKLHLEPGRIPTIEVFRRSYLLHVATPLKSLEAMAAAVLGLLGRRADWPALRAAGRKFDETERTWRASAAHYRPAFDSLTLQPA